MICERNIKETLVAKQDPRSFKIDFINHHLLRIQ
jgi:hypothetical protein